MSDGAGGGKRHWRNQRVTAIALIPLGLWFLLSLIRQPGLDYAVVSGWFAKPLQALLAALFGAALLWHSMQGVEVVLEDYTRGRSLRSAMWVARFLHGAAALALAWSVYALATGGAP